MGACASANNTSKEKPYKKTTSEVTLQVRTDNIRDYYQIGEKIASGGFGSVFMASHLTSRKIRAVKFINIYGLSQRDISNLLKEANLLKTTDHPNILKVYEVFRDKNSIYFVTEFLKGGELFERIVKKGALSENQAAKYMSDIVSAVVHLHSLNIVHRDLKPENILFDSKHENATLKIIDFGTCRNFDKGGTMKERIGSSFYMAPEVITGNYTEKCDIWSLGVILYILLAGFPPFSGSNDSEILMNVVRNNLRFDAKCWENVSLEAIRLIKSMLVNSFSDRPTAEQVFQNSWLQSHSKNEAPDRDLTKKSLSNLAKYQITNQLQRATLNFIANELLSEKEIKELQKTFKKIDKNGDGFLSKEEVEEALAEFPGSFEGNISELLNRVDADGNGMINYSEFLTSVVNWDKNLSNERLRQAFKQFDKDGNGTLSIDELFEALGGNKGQNLRFLEMVKEADANGDGEIDLEEFIAFMKKFKTEEE